MSPLVLNILDSGFVLKLSIYWDCISDNNLCNSRVECPWDVITKSIFETLHHGYVKRKCTSRIISSLIINDSVHVFMESPVMLSDEMIDHERFVDFILSCS